MTSSEVSVMEKELSVIIVDDFEMSRLGMRQMLKNIKDINTIREAENSKELTDLIKKDEPDIIFMDIQLGDEIGIDITRQILAKYPDTIILAITSSKEIQHFSEMLEAGAAGFLLKNINQAELEQAIHEVINGNMYFSKEFHDIAKKLLPKQKKRNQVNLTDREKEILRLICLGNSNQEIADELKLSTHTIDAHRKKLLSKTGARNTASMITISLRDGLIDIS